MVTVLLWSPIKVLYAVQNAIGLVELSYKASGDIYITMYV